MIAARDIEQWPRPFAELKVDVVCDGLSFAALRGEWDELLDDSEAGVFNSWEWLYPWYRRIAPERELRIIEARSDGRLVGLMPLCLERRRAAGRIARRLCFLGESEVGSDYLDIVARRGFELPVAQAAAAALRQMSSDREWDLLDLVDLDSQSASVQVLREIFEAAKYRVRTSPRYVCPFETFGAGETFERFLARTRRQDNFLRRRNWLEKQPGYRLEIERRPDRMASPLSEFLRLHGLRWASDGGSQGIRGARTEGFHRDAIELLAERGQARLYTLAIGSRPLASVYAIVHRRKFIFYQSGYDPEWRGKSVGLVLLGETFRDCLAGGLAEYDFLRGEEAYKLDWATRQRRTVGLRIFAPGSAGDWLDKQERVATAAREVIKRLLPARWVEAIRIRRRRRSVV